MVSRILSIIGIIIILLSICALLFFPVQTNSFVRGVIQGENLVDSSVGPILASEANAIAAALIEEADAASDQPELDTVVAKATAQADLINSAATAPNRENLIAALQAAAERIAAQMEVAQAQAEEAAAQTATAEAQAQATQDEATATAVARLTAEAQPTDTPIPTPTPIPPTETPDPTPPTLPETGDTMLQAVPTVVVEANWPKETEINHAEFIRVTLVQVSEGVFVPTVEAGVEREVIAATPKPVPNSTPEVPIQSAFGEGYRSFAVAKLSIGETAFEVSGPNPRERQSLDRSEITWTWSITPKQPGQHVANLLVEVEWESIGESGPAPEPFTIWAPDLTINVAEPPFLVRGQLNFLSILGMLIGSGLNIPFLYKVMQDRRKTSEGGE